MTSRRYVLEKHSTDELGSLIRWALRERVTGAAPSPWVWERIRVRAERPTAWSLVKLVSGRGYRAVMAQCSSVGAFLSAQIVSWMWPQNRRGEWKLDPCFTRPLFDQYGFFLLRLSFKAF
jgi:hypothetical protein